MRARSPCIYLLASAPRGTLYVGVTSDPVQRVWQHRNDLPKDSPAATARTPWSGTNRIRTRIRPSPAKSASHPGSAPGNRN